MSDFCPISLDRGRLQDEVRETYARVATSPNSDFHFHRGPVYAATMLGYDPRELAALPPETTASFAGLANPHAIGPIYPGETVLDIGSGAGTDLLLAARRVGPTGKALGVDLTQEMIERAQNSAHMLGLAHVEIRQGDAETLPVESASVDVVISNGVLNLAPNKERAYREIARVLRPGGRLYLSDVTAQGFSDEIRGDFELWAG